MKALGDTPEQANNLLDVAGALTDALILGLAMIGIMLAFAVLALQIIVTLVEFKIVTLGGFVLLPFGIWSKSAFLAERPLGFVVSSGLKVLALAIVVSGARSVFDQLQPSSDPDLYEALAILAASLLLAMLALFVPNLASALVTGGPALGAGTLVTGAIAVGGAGVAAIAGAAGFGAAASRMVSQSRAAAGASQGRPSAGPGGTSPRPTNDNPPPGSGPGSVYGPRTPYPAAGGGTQDPVRSAEAGEGSSDPKPSAASEAISRETESARRDFLRAANAPERAERARVRGGRSAALQAFFVANAGRALLPGNESSGALTPQLKDEEP